MFDYDTIKSQYIFEKYMIQALRDKRLVWILRTCQEKTQTLDPGVNDSTVGLFPYHIALLFWFECRLCCEERTHQISIPFCT